MSRAGRFLKCRVGESLVQIGVSADNVLSGNAPPELVASAS